MLRSVLGNIDVWGIVLKAVLIIVAVVLIVTLVVYLCRLPMNLMMSPTITNSTSRRGIHAVKSGRASLVVLFMCQGSLLRPTTPTSCGRCSKVSARLRTLTWLCPIRVIRCSLSLPIKQKFQGCSQAIWCLIRCLQF